MKLSSRLLWVSATALAACSSEDTGTVDLSPPPAGLGLQYRMLSELAPGVETERCHFFVAPPGGLNINRQETKFTPGSHHVLLYTTPYPAIPTQDRFGNDVDTTGVFECGAEGPTAHWEVDGVAGGSQTADGPPLIDDLPEDVAIKIAGGTVLLMNTHYLNATAEPLLTDARINLFTVPEEQVKREAGVVFFYNPFIRVPAQGASTARAVCPVIQDVFLVNAQSHMHRRGIGFRAELLDAQGNSLQELYRGTEWEQVVLRKNTPHTPLEAGQFIDYRCGYQNPEDRVVTQGLSTKDEMCMFLGIYYPRNRQFELCGLDHTWEGGFLGARWIGAGTRTGAETLGCFMGAKGVDVDKGDSFYSCVVESCPKISVQVSEAARCLMTQGLGQCGQACTQGEEGCRGCVVSTCEAKMGALASATCE